MRRDCGRERTVMTQGHEHTEQRFGQTLSDFLPITVIAISFSCIFFFFEFQFWIPNHSCLHNIRDWTLIRSKPPLWPTHISAQVKTKRKNTLWRPSVRSGLWVQAKLWSIPPPASHVSSQRLQINSKLWTSLSVLNINKQLDQLSPLTLSELDQFESWFLA